MQLGDIIRGFSEEARASEALLAGGDIVLVARVGEAAGRYEETVGEYAAGAVRRFANLAVSEDWLGLMNVIERAADPGIDCLAYMVDWSLKQDEAPTAGAACRAAAAAEAEAARERTTRKDVAGPHDLARIGILVVSDRASSGEYEDKSGKAINDYLDRAVRSNWISIVKIVPDGVDNVAIALVEIVDVEGATSF